ncbi:HAD family phosphatase [Fodinicurvata sp. EGI_FJ10296]|uniref:HAD family hydrolase n=1 Tax=Fodinicurvata sp. EGI_FJ10296 TaxID=3231908 RepID=UPI0034564AF3
MNETKPPRVIVFDVGRVLVEWDPDRLYGQLIPDAAERQAFFDRVGLEKMNVDADRYGSLERHVATLAENYPADAHLILPWWHQWHEMCWAEKPETARLLEAVRAAGFPVWALSNFAMDTFAIAQTRFPILTTFDGMVISGNEKTVKPEAEIYAILEKRTGLTGSDLFFIDDKAENIAAAEARGWQGHLFDDPAELAADLRRLGIIA